MKQHKYRLRTTSTIGFLAAAATAIAFAQPQNVSQVLLWSTVSNRSVQGSGSGTLNNALFTVYTATPRADPNSPDFGSIISTPSNYSPTVSAISSALSSNIAVALSSIPLAAPTSAKIFKTDPATGAPLPASATLGPIFTQRAETIGKGKFYLGFSHQAYHFTSIYGQSLNGLSVLDPGGKPSGVVNPATGAQSLTAPASFNVAADVRLAQTVAMITYGVTNRFDISVGLPMVHSAVAATAYNGIVYSGSGTDFNPGNQCWCVNTLTPGTFDLASPSIGRAAKSASGFGDIILRAKGTAISKERAALALGVDVRLPSGDAENFLGVGTASAKPFAAFSYYTNPIGKFVFAPHVDFGWQFSGSSILGGEMTGSQQSATLSDGSRVNYSGAPVVQTKGTLPDILTWSVGTEVGIGNRNTLVLDVVGNHIGMVHGARMLAMANRPSAFAAPAGIAAQSAGLVDAGKGSFGQYSGAFGYKMKLAGNLVLFVQALVRFDDNALTARVTPLYGLGYSF